MYYATRSLCTLVLPCIGPGHERVDVLVEMAIGQLGEEITQIGIGFDAVHLACADQAGEAGPVAATFVMAGKERIAAVHGPRARERALWRWLETRREWWAHQIARCAALFDAIEHPDTSSFAATAQALLAGRDLKKIPIMVDILEQIFQAWAFESNNATDAGDSLEFISVAQEDGPTVEREGELAALLEGAKITADWIDGYLMAIIIAPKMITPNRWMPPLFDRVPDGMGPLELQRFLDIVMIRANGAITVAEVPANFVAQMTERGHKGQQDWATGFTLGCEKFQSSWPARSSDPNDRAIQRQISEASSGRLEPREIRIVSQWLSARHAANMTEA